MKLVELKKKKKAKNPEFIRQDAHKKSKLGKNWRKPRGIDSKIRLQLKGYRKLVKSGYGTPKILRTKDAEGRNIVVINNTSDLSKAGKEDAIVIASNVGMRKRAEIVKEAIKQNKTFVNVDVKTYPEKIKKAMEKRKEKKKKTEVEKEKKKKELEKKPAKSIEEKVDVGEEEKKKLEKEEKDKLLRKEQY